MKKFAFVVVAMAGALVFVPAAVASDRGPVRDRRAGMAIPSQTVAGPQDGTCGANSAVNLNVDNVQNDYAKVTWTPGTPGIPAGLTLGGPDRDRLICGQ